MPTLLLPSSRVARIAAAFLAIAGTACAQSLLASSTVPLDSLSAFKSPGANWQLAGGIGGDPRTQKAIVPLPGIGVLVNNPTDAIKSNLVTTWEHSDLDFDLDFLMTPGSNSGVYLMSRYEVQLFDSWGVKTPTSGDCGGIYHRWDPARGAGKEGYDGSAPSANACRAPGLWQHLHIEFQAPRFDAAGKKTSNARFVKVVLNGFTVQENVEISGPTRGAALTEEGPTGPILIQGDHGPVALRAITFKKFDPAATGVQLENITYKLYSATSEEIGVYDSTKPTAESPATNLDVAPFEKSGKFAVAFSGSMVVPRDGVYAFSSGGWEPTRVLIDNQPAVAPSGAGGETVPITLTAGRHPFRIDYIHTSWGRLSFNLSVEGPGLASRVLSVAAAGGAHDSKPRQLLIEPSADRIRMQRSFVPFDPKKRLYAINVGSPTGLNYAYDFETAAILRVWRGSFLDTFEMWDGRGENQLGKPAGPALTLINKPVLALLERSSNDWPDQPDMMWSSQGYKLEPDGQPTFLFKLSTLSATDRIAPAPESHGLTRTLTIKGRTTSWESWVLLAEADHITAQPDGRGYIIGDRAYYLDLPAKSAVLPILRTRNGHQQLAVPIGGATLDKPIVYTLVW